MNEPFPHPVALLKKHGLAAKKSWGQNFLVAERIYRAIVDATVEENSDCVVEFGAGLGTLTMRLAERLPEGQVVAVERDREMVGVLERELGHLDNVEVVPANAATYDLAAVSRWQGQPVTVCGNLPYHISTRIIMNTLAAGDVVRKAVFMVQREVGARLLAQCGTKEYGALSVVVQALAAGYSVTMVPPGSFHPKPKVDSQVVGLRPLPAEERVPRAAFKHFSEVVHAAFAQRRKTLRNSLRSRFAVDVVEQALEQSGIDGGRRGETLTQAEFRLLASHVQSDAGAA